jgi:hypothetical protein
MHIYYIFWIIGCFRNSVYKLFMCQNLKMPVDTVCNTLLIFIACRNSQLLRLTLWYHCCMSRLICEDHEHGCSFRYTPARPLSQTKTQASVPSRNHTISQSSMFWDGKTTLWSKERYRPLAIPLEVHVTTLKERYRPLAIPLVVHVTTLKACKKSSEPAEFT